MPRTARLCLLRWDCFGPARSSHCGPGSARDIPASFSVARAVKHSERRRRQSRSSTLAQTACCEAPNWEAAQPDPASLMVSGTPWRSFTKRTGGSFMSTEHGLRLRPIPTRTIDRFSRARPATASRRAGQPRKTDGCRSSERSRLSALRGTPGPKRRLPRIGSELTSTDAELPQPQPPQYGTQTAISPFPRLFHA